MTEWELWLKDDNHRERLETHKRAISWDWFVKEAKKLKANRIQIDFENNQIMFVKW